MAEPTVACVMLTRDRPEYARLALECFRSQTYENKRLVIFDTGSMDDLATDDGLIVHIKGLRGRTIGELRNAANTHSKADIIIHFDDDDWSQPNRIAEQVALLQSSGADCVGYREMLFWREPVLFWREPEILFYPGEAWLYSVPSPSWVLGTSFCYWRRVWEQHKFPDLPRLVDGKPVPDSASEDVIWRRGVKCLGYSSITPDGYPRMIARIHGGNTTNYADLLGPRAGNTWKRAPEWDEHCGAVMK